MAGERTPARRAVSESTAAVMAREGDPGEPPEVQNYLTFAPGTTFKAMGFIDTSIQRPDGSAAAGATQFIAVANGRIRSFTKAGTADGVLNLKPDVFFASVRGSGTTLGGRIRFDRLSSRWFIAMATNAVPGRVVIASSNAATIAANTIWSFSSFDDTFGSNNCTTDGPTLGVDASALYIGVNQFCGSGSPFAGSSGYVVRKTSVLDGATPVVTAFHNLTGTVSGPGPLSPQGVSNDDAAATTGYFLGVDNASLGTLMLRRVSNPATTPTIFANVAIPVAPTALPIPVRHQGNTGGATGYLSANDDRLASVTIRNGRAWVAHTIGVTETGAAGATRNGVRWYEIGSLDTTPVLLQSGTLNDTVGAGSVDERNYFNGSIAASSAGRVVIGFTAAGTREFANAGVADRILSDAAGTFRTPTLSTAAAAAYNPPGDPGSPSGRQWGSYSETVVDGCDGTTIWSLQQYVDQANSYGLQAAQVQTDAPPSIVSVTPSVVPAGQASVNLAVGASASGNAAFFDPPAGFACRISAAIPGLTVNSVTVTSPTSVTVNVSTVGATGGLKTVTVSNPDGQSSTAAGLLNVVAGPVLVIEAPAAGTVGQPLLVRGYAFDGSAAGGTGLATVNVYVTPAGGAKLFLGAATYGSLRSDVAKLYGAPFSASGFSLRAAQVLASGAYTVTVDGLTSQSAVLVSQSVAVTLKSPVVPFGVLDTPANGVTVAGEMGVTGWALDEAGIKDVTIYRSASASEAPGLVFLGDANFSRGARPDVQAGYPAIPDADNAGWGYMVLTNMLPGQGPGLTPTFTIFAYATNYAGQTTLLGSRQVIVANSASTAPFGSIDTPGQGETVSGVIVNFGWALAVAGRTIPIDGSTIDVFIDNVNVGHPVYNNPRSDIAALFPGLANTNGPVGYYMIDTRTLADGVHTIAWIIRDNTGQVSGVGSRFFRVQNGS